MVNHRIEGHTAVLTIDNPPANTWTPESLRGLEKLVGELDADRDIYAAVITGAGEKFFRGRGPQGNSRATRCTCATSSPASVRPSRRS